MLVSYDFAVVQHKAWHKICIHQHHISTTRTQSFYGSSLIDITKPWLSRSPPSRSLVCTFQSLNLDASQHSQPTMCQVVNMYHCHCRHKMEHRLVHRCTEGFCTRFNPCQGSMKPVIAITSRLQSPLMRPLPQQTQIGHLKSASYLSQ